MVCIVFFSFFACFILLQNIPQTHDQSNGITKYQLINSILIQIQFNWPSLVWTEMSPPHKITKVTNLLNMMKSIYLSGFLKLIFIFCNKFKMTNVELILTTTKLLHWNYKILISILNGAQLCSTDYIWTIRLNFQQFFLFHEVDPEEMAGKINNDNITDKVSDTKVQ